MTLTGNQVRQSFIDFFAERGHTVVPSAPLVPGGDSTLLFTNAGMVQFKDVFLGTDTRPYVRAVDSQKCLRVSGKHNDLDTVGRDETHHTFFEMLGNWSFGDYYKKEAIGWSWELLTSVWGLDPKRLYATVFRDDQGTLPDDQEAADTWLAQPGFDPTHLLWAGRKDNLWEMAETGPCGPCTEIHYDFGPERCDKQGVPGHVCEVNGDCLRIVEIWNNVFIQYNRVSPTEFLPLPKRHVDTGMGFERIVSIIQNVPGNYSTDLFRPLMDEIQRLAGQTDAERQADLTPYRVIADHVRAASFLIAEGVVPGNIGRNYVCRMIIRRAARFARKIGLNQPFMANVAQKVIDGYQEAYPELPQNRALILETFTREETRFGETLDAGFAELNRLMEDLRAKGQDTLGGKPAFDLYATLGIPLELTRDILEEEALKVDEAGFFEAMEAHRLASGKGQTFGELDAGRTEFYTQEVQELIAAGKLSADGVHVDPYGPLCLKSTVLLIFKGDKALTEANAGDQVEILLADSPLYLESGGQVADTGRVISDPAGQWEVRVSGTRKPAPGAVILEGEVLSGTPQVGDAALVEVDRERRASIMRNHTATHLLHKVLRQVLGEGVHQAGSSVAPDRFRFDFNYPQGLTQHQLQEIERGVNQAILAGYPVIKETKSLDQAKAEGAIALFGEKYGQEVRTVQVGVDPDRFSYELCGGTHVSNTAEIGSFYILSEGSLAAGVRRIEAVTGQKAYDFARSQLDLLGGLATNLETSPADALQKVESLQEHLRESEKHVEALQTLLANQVFATQLDNLQEVSGVPYLAVMIPDASQETLRGLADQFRQKHPSGVVVLGSAVEGKPSFIAAVTPDLIARGLRAGDLIKQVAAKVGGGGGGRPDLAQAGGKDPTRIAEALDQVAAFIRENVK